MNAYESIFYLRERTVMLRTSKTSWNRLRWCLKDLDAVDALVALATEGLAGRDHGHVDRALVSLHVQADDVRDSDERDAIAEELVRVLTPAIERAKASRAGTRRERLLSKVKVINR